MRIAVIPARGGSKRIPRKNIRDFHGKPMIAWSLEAARDSGCFDRIVVSTDDEEIAGVSRDWGAEVPFMRPPGLSGDHVATAPVIRHAIESLQQQGSAPSHVCCIYATAPFLQAADLRRGLEFMLASDADYAFSVTSFPFPIQRALRISEAGRVEMFWPENAMVRSQDLEEAFHDAGQFYWGTLAAWLAERPIFSSGSLPVRLPRHRVQDIDSEEDWRRAELLFPAVRAGTE